MVTKLLLSNATSSNTTSLNSRILAPVRPRMQAAGLDFVQHVCVSPTTKAVNVAARAVCIEIGSKSVFRPSVPLAAALSPSPHIFRYGVFPEDTYVCIYIYIYTYVYICIHIHTYVCMYIYIYIYVYTCMYVYIYIYTCMYVCRHTHVYTCTCIHTHICTYIRSPKSLQI